jgi:hypothetical protein
MGSNRLFFEVVHSLVPLFELPQSKEHWGAASAATAAAQSFRKLRRLSGAVIFASFSSAERGQTARETLLNRLTRQTICLSVHKVLEIDNEFSKKKKATREQF